MKVGILYIALGDYWVFWKDFYESCEKNFLPGVDKEYFVFTNYRDYDKFKNVNIYYQEDLGWPGNTLLRFRMFSEIENDLLRCNYLFFFNSNVLFVDTVYENEIIPKKDDNDLTALTWNVFSNNKMFPYDRNNESTAYIPNNEGSVYYQGGLNGGEVTEFLKLINSCRENIEFDIKNNIIAKNHDESHLNKYLLNITVKTLDTTYGKPEEWEKPKSPKIIFRDKNKVLGKHFVDTLKKRNSNRLYSLIKQIFTHY